MSTATKWGTYLLLCLVGGTAWIFFSSCSDEPVSVLTFVEPEIAGGNEIVDLPLAVGTKPIRSDPAGGP